MPEKEFKDRRENPVNLTITALKQREAAINAELTQLAKTIQEAERRQKPLREEASQLNEMLLYLEQNKTTIQDLVPREVSTDGSECEN